MNDEKHAIINFLTVIGISAQVLDDADGNPLIQMPTAQYEPRRNIIDPWYTLISQSSDQSFFRPRLRATGLTTI